MCSYFAGRRRKLVYKNKAVIHDEYIRCHLVMSLWLYGTVRDMCVNESTEYGKVLAVWMNTVTGTAFSEILRNLCLKGASVIADVGFWHFLTSCLMHESHFIFVMFKRLHTAFALHQISSITIGWTNFFFLSFFHTTLSLCICTTVVLH